MNMNILLKHLICFLIRKTAVTTNHDRHIPAVSLTYELNNCTDPVNIIGPMVGMGAAFSEQYVYQERPPAYMKGLKTSLALVGNFIAFAFNRIIVIQHHGIGSQFYDPWFGDMKPPNK